MFLLAVPRTGLAVQLKPFDYFYVQAGRENPGQPLETAWELIKASGRHVLNEGEPVREKGEALKILRKQEEHFEKIVAPILKSMDVI